MEHTLCYVCLVLPRQSPELLARLYELFCIELSDTVLGRESSEILEVSLDGDAYPASA